MTTVYMNVLLVLLHWDHTIVLYYNCTKVPPLSGTAAPRELFKAPENVRGRGARKTRH